jgi:hypothetical protein
VVLVSVGDLVHAEVEPLSSWEGTSDWRERASRLGRLGDALATKCREDGAWTNESPVRELQPFLPTAARVQAAADAVQRPGASFPPPSLGHLSGVATGTDLETLRSVADGLDGAEKIVISACAWAVRNLECPPAMIADLLAIIFEEAAHLEAVLVLLGIDDGVGSWLDDDRGANWDAVIRTTSPLQYMLVEHGLYEGRGTVASAYGAFQLEQAGVSDGVLKVMSAIACQEASHNTLGFKWLALLRGDERETHAEIAQGLELFLHADPLPPRDGSTRSLRKHFPAFLLDLYLQTWSFAAVKREIEDASRSVRSTGALKVSDDELYSRSRRLEVWLEQSREN